MSTAQRDYSYSRPALETSALRFWLTVDKLNGPVLAHVAHLGRCWIWTAGRARFGYGCHSHDGSIIPAHRYCWELYNGAVPSHLVVMHRCDNPSCVRPDHLRLGTDKENMDDMVAKGRARFYGRGAPKKERRQETRSVPPQQIASSRYAVRDDDPGRVYSEPMMSTHNVAAHLGVTIRQAQTLIKRHAEASQVGRVLLLPERCLPDLETRRGRGRPRTKAV